MNKIRKPVSILLTLILTLSVLSALGLVSYAEDTQTAEPAAEPFVFMRGTCGPRDDLSTTPYTVEHDENGASLINRWGDNLTWTLDTDMTLTISGYGEMADFAHDYEENGEPHSYVVVPWANSTYGAYGMTQAMYRFLDLDPDTTDEEFMALMESGELLDRPGYEEAMRFNHDVTFNFIKKVVIGEGVTSIGDCAFIGHNIREVSLPSSLETIGRGAFMGSKIWSIDIPASVNSIGLHAFSMTEPRHVTIRTPQLLINEDPDFAGHPFVQEIAITDYNFDPSGLQVAAVGDGFPFTGEDAYDRYTAFATLYDFASTLYKGLELQRTRDDRANDYIEEQQTQYGRTCTLEQAYDRIEWHDYIYVVDDFNQKYHEDYKTLDELLDFELRMLREGLEIDVWGYEDLYDDVVYPAPDPSDSEPPTASAIDWNDAFKQAFLDVFGVDLDDLTNATPTVCAMNELAANGLHAVPWLTIKATAASAARTAADAYGVRFECAVHDMGRWVIDTPRTETEPGLYRRDCENNCGYCEYMEAPAIGELHWVDLPTSPEGLADGDYYLDFSDFFPAVGEGQEALDMYNAGEFRFDPEKLWFYEKITIPAAMSESGEDEVREMTDFIENDGFELMGICLRQKGAQWYPVKKTTEGLSDGDWYVDLSALDDDTRARLEECDIYVNPNGTLLRYKVVPPKTGDEDVDYFEYFPLMTRWMELFREGYPIYGTEIDPYWQWPEVCPIEQYTAAPDFGELHWVDLPTSPAGLSAGDYYVDFDAYIALQKEISHGTDPAAFDDLLAALNAGRYAFDPDKLVFREKYTLPEALGGAVVENEGFISANASLDKFSYCLRQAGEWMPVHKSTDGLLDGDWYIDLAAASGEIRAELENCDIYINPNGTLLRYKVVPAGATNVRDYPGEYFPLTTRILELEAAFYHPGDAQIDPAWLAWPNVCPVAQYVTPDGPGADGPEEPAQKPSFFRRIVQFLLSLVEFLKRIFH